MKRRCPHPTRSAAPPLALPPGSRSPGYISAGSRLDLGWISARSGRQAAVLRAPRVSDERVDGDHRLERGEAGLTKDQLSLKEEQPTPSLESAARVAFLASSLKDATTSACTSGLAASSFGSPSMPTPLAASTSAFSLTCASATYPTACLASSRAISQPTSVACASGTERSSVWSAKQQTPPASTSTNGELL